MSVKISKNHKNLFKNLFEKSVGETLSVGLINLNGTFEIIEILQSMKDIEFHHFIKDSRMSELSEFF